MRSKCYIVLTVIVAIVFLAFCSAVGFIGLLLIVMIKETRYSGYPYLSVGNALSALPLALALFVAIAGYLAVLAFRELKHQGEA